MKVSERRGLSPALLAAILAINGRVFAEFDPLRDPRIKSLREEQRKLVADNDAIQALVDAENREMSEDEATEYDGNNEEFERLEAEIGRRIRSGRNSARMEQVEEELDAPRGRRTSASAGDEVDEDDGEAERSARLRNRRERQAEPPARPRANGDAARDLGSPARRSQTHGFRSSAEFYRQVRLGSMKGAEPDPRLFAASASTYGNENTGADGGFAVPPDYRNTIMERVFDEDSLIARTDQQITSSNSITFPSDMTTPWDSTGGIQAYWEGEAAAIPQSKPKLETVSARLAKLTVLVPVTEELLEDAPSMANYVERKAGEKIDFKVSYALTWGSGAGMPLGFMNAGCLVTQAAESAQTADTIVAANALKMWGRMPVRSRRNAIWLIHPDAEQQLPQMVIGTQPVYMPPGGMSQSMYGTLLGRPVVPHEVCETVGDLGDFMLVDWSSYLTVKKAAGIKASTSIHIWFDQDLTAFKYTFRLGGQPWWSAAINPRDGSSTRSPFVTLAAR